MKSVLKNFYFVLRSFKTSSVLNLLGLSVSMAVFAVIGIQCWYDLTYDRNFRNSKDIYFFTQYWENYDTKVVSMSMPLAKKLAESFPEIITYSLLSENEGIIEIPGKEYSLFDLNVIKVTKGFPEIFTPAVIAGNPDGIFTTYDKAMLTVDVAQRLFPGEDPLGKELIIQNSSERITVVAVCESFPDNCSLQNGIYMQLPEDSRMKMHNYQGFFMVKNENMKILENKVNAPEFIHSLETVREIGFVPLTDVYFHLPEKYAPHGNLATTLSLMAIGMGILLIAFINFINFSIALIPARIKGITIRKILGVEQQKMKWLLLSESVCFVFISFFISLLLVKIFSSAAIAEFFTANLDLKNNSLFLLTILIVVLGIAVLFSLYPIHYMTTFKPAMALAGRFSLSGKSSFLRNLLITFQFFVSLVLIIVSGFIKLQHDYMVDYSWGIQKENILYFHVNMQDITYATVKEELLKIPSVKDVAVSQALPGKINQDWGRELDGKELWFATWIVSSNFPEFFGFEMVEGRSFHSSDEEMSRVIVNETLVKTYELENIVGKSMEGDLEIVGVSKDANFESLHVDIRPMIFFTGNFKNHYWYGHFLVKTDGTDTRTTVERIRETWKKISDEPLPVSFLDVHLDNLYKAENTLGKLIFIFGLITIIIAIMGIYGLIVFNIRYKEREIAIRKVNGATIKDIMLLLNKNLFIQLGIAFILAIPVAYVIVRKWLEGFAYQVPVYYWVFLLAGLIVLLITLLTVSLQSYKAAVTNPREVLSKE